MSDEEKKDEVGAELSDFLGSLEKTAEEESSTEKVEVEEKKDAVEEKAVKPEGKVEEKVEAKTPVKDEKKEVEPEDDLRGMSDQELRSLVRGLRTRVDDAHGRLIASGTAIKPEQKVDSTVTPAEEKKIEKKVEAEVVNFLKDVNMDDIIDSPEALNKLLVSVYNKAITDAETRAVEKVLRSIPQLVVNYASRHATMTDLVRDFYSANPDLAQVKRTVATVANEVAAEHADWEVKTVFEEAAKRTRELLGLKKREKVAPSDKGKDPAFVRKGGGARRSVDTSQMNDLQKEIADTLT